MIMDFQNSMITILNRGITTWKLESSTLLVLMIQTVTLRVTLFPNYLHYKLNQASSALVNRVVGI
jgi:hypothetical protein